MRKIKKNRKEYQKIWQAKRRKSLAEQGFKEIRVWVHRDYEKIIRSLAKRDFQRRVRREKISEKKL